ncbi:MAG: hypothetical protein ACRDTJ_28425 [Pseudonocardiaceae bacterium]
MSPRIGSRSVRQIGELQERAAWAVPAAAQENKDGCWLRYTDSKTTWWAGAALMHGRGPMRELVRSIALAEDFYAAHGERARFRVRLLDTLLSLVGAMRTQAYRAARQAEDQRCYPS